MRSITRWWRAVSLTGNRPLALQNIHCGESTGQSRKTIIAVMRRGSQPGRLALKTRVEPICAEFLFFITPIALAAVLVATTGAAEPTVQLLADSYTVCHGTDGSTPGSTDGLEDIKNEEILEEMIEFKCEPGKGRLMGPIGRGITDTQIKALVVHFQSLNR